MEEEKKDARRRVVVEEVGSSEKEPEEKASSEDQPLEQIQEKAEEIETLAEEAKTDTVPENEIHEEDHHVHQPADFVPPRNDGGQNPLVIIIPGLFLLGALLGGIVFYQNSLNKGTEATPTPVSASVESPAPTASSSASVDLSKYEIAIQNGSGIPGAASDAKDVLTKAGFTVSSTGNAASYSYTQSVIQAKDTVDQAFLDKLSSVLSDTYKMGKQTTLDASSGEDVIVIIGSSKAQ